MKCCETGVILALATSCALTIVGLASDGRAFIYWNSAYSGGTWTDTGGTGWNTSGSGTIYNYAWGYGGNYDANFTGTAGIVTVSGTISSVNSITFSTDGYTLNGGTINLTGTGGPIATGSGTDTINSSLSGTVGLTKTGSGTLKLTGTNTYTGVTTLTAGTLSVSTIGNGGVAGNLGMASSAATNLVFDGGALQYTGATASTDRAFTIGAAKTATIQVDGAANLTISGSNTTATTGALTKTGTGTLTLSGANAYTGGTTISGGVLNLATGSNRLATTGAITITSGTLDLGGNSQETSGNVSILSGVVQNGTLRKSGGNFDVYAGTISANLADGAGTAGLVKTGSAGASLTGVNTYTGGTNVGAGILSIASTAALPGWNTAGKYTVGSGAALIVGDSVADADVATMWGTGNFSAGAAVGFDVTGTRTFDTGIVPSHLGLVKSGSGTLILTGSNVFSGGVTLSQGQLTIGSVTALGTGTFTIGGSGSCVINSPTITNFTISTNNPMVWNGDFSYGSGYNLDLGNGPVTLGANVVVNGSNNMLTVGGTISGNYSLTKTGTGPLTLSGANTFTGGMTLSDGQLNINNGQALGTGTFTVGGSVNSCEISNTSGSSVTLWNNNPIVFLRGATFNDQGGNDINLGNGPVTLSASEVRLTIYSQSRVVIGGAISGSGRLTLVNDNGSGSTLVLSGNNTYSGGTIVDTEPTGFTHTLLATKTAALPGFDAPGKVVVGSGGVLAVNYGGGGDWSSADVETLRANASFAGGSFLGFDTTNATAGTTYASPITGAIGIVKLGDNSLTLSTPNTYTGGTNVVSGTLNLAAGNNGLATTGAITVTGGTLDLGGNSQITSGNVIIQGGNVQNGILETSGSLTINGGNVQNGTLRKSGGDFDAQAGVISAVLADGTSAARMHKTGTGSLILSGANTYSGGTRIYGGTLQATRAAALPGYNSPGAVTVSGGVSGAAILAVNYGGGDDWTSTEVDTLRANTTFGTGSGSFLGFDTTNAAAGATYASAITGTLGIVKLGTNSLTLSGPNTYTGGTIVREGTLVLGGNGCLGTWDINVFSGTLNLGGYSQATSFGIHVYGGAVVNGLLKSNGGNFDIQAGAISAILADGTSQAGIFKSSAGTAILSGSNTYTGKTTVSAGTLNVANATGSATGSGAVTVNSGATLSGSGIVAGPVTIAGILAPGNSPGILTVNNQVTFQAGSTFDVELSGLVAGSGYDQLTTTGPVSLAGSIAMDFGSFTPTGHDLMFVINNTGSGATTGTFQYADDAKLGTFDGYDWYITYDANNAVSPSLNGGNDVAIYSVPEPSALILLVVGVLALLFYAWQRWIRLTNKQTLSLVSSNASFRTLRCHLHGRTERSLTLLSQETTV